VKIFDESSIAELRIEEEGLFLKISKNAGATTVYQQPMIQTTPVESKQDFAHQPATDAPKTEKVEIPEKKDEETLGGHLIKSPIVGTFYRSPSPDSEPYVEIGTHIVKGSTICIVEAMKLMNEIESDTTGTITKILLENAQPVEYGQPLFVIKPD
jgi:acetyl-CoA carboxylase biotin carboxyl carrier protein